jgi:hypothetical protein
MSILVFAVLQLLDQYQHRASGGDGEVAPQRQMSATT